MEKVVVSLSPRELSEASLEQIISGTYQAKENLNDQYRLDNPNRGLGGGGGQANAVLSGNTESENPDRSLLIVNIRASSAANSMVGGNSVKFEARGASLHQILGSLRRVPEGRVILPAEFDNKRYDIQLSMRANKSGNIGPIAEQMIEAALGLELRQVMRELDTYVLTAPNGLIGSLRRTTTTSFHLTSGDGVIAAQAADLNRLTSAIERILNVPVVDETNLEGKSDWDLVFDGKNPTSVLDVIKRDFGMNLTLAKRQIEVVVVEAK